MTLPTFTRETAESHFKSTYMVPQPSFQPTNWMPGMPTPLVLFVEEVITADEMQQFIQKYKTTSTLIPVDQMSRHLVFGILCVQEVSIPPTSPTVPLQCLPVYLICVIMVEEGGAPPAWQGVCQDPREPSNFRPIVLTSCLGKLYTSVLKGHRTQFMTANGYTS